MTSAIIEIEGEDEIVIYKGKDANRENLLEFLCEFNKDYESNYGSTLFKPCALIRHTTTLPKELNDNDWIIFPKNNQGLDQDITYTLKLDGSVTHVNS